MMWINEPWVEDALCAQTDPEAFFPKKGDPAGPAKRICLACDVRPDCLTYALRHNERFGIWGGLAFREREKLTGQEHPDGTLDTATDHDAA